MASNKIKKKVFFWGVGRRKEAVARVRLFPAGSGKIVVNDRELDNYFQLDNLKYIVKQPLVLLDKLDKYDVFVNVQGGGFTGQAYAIRMGITRALMLDDASLRPALKKAGFVTRDARVKERKKYGLKKARKSPQFSKR